MKDNIAIEIINVTKKYVMHHEKPTLVERLFSHKDEIFTALRNINLTIKKGERVGVIGANGSGKTTFLKIVSGIATPTTGKVVVKGKIVSLIDLEAGFHPDLTGLQNIYLNGMILGMKNSEIKSSLKNIIEFANIGKFIDTQLFTYSQGMKLRLSFAVAIHVNPDILILDENISVGDIDFQKKCVEKLAEFIKCGKTLIIASHDLNYLKDNCNRVVYLKNGRLFKTGRIDLIEQYRKSYTNNS